MVNIKRGQVYYADLSPVIGSEQGGLRPVLIVQNDIGNRYSPTVIVVVLTSKLGKHEIPTHVHYDGLRKESIILCEQIRTIDKRRLKELMGQISEATMEQVDKAIKISLGV